VAELATVLVEVVVVLEVLVALVAGVVEAILVCVIDISGVLITLLMR
jgi:hypothetical protein